MRKQSRETNKSRGARQQQAENLAQVQIAETRIHIDKMKNCPKARAGEFSIFTPRTDEIMRGRCVIREE